MKNNNAYCPVCGDTEYKNINGQPACKNCGHVITEEEISNDIKARFHELREQSEGEYLVIGEAKGEEAYEIMMNFTKSTTGQGVSVTTKQHILDN